MSSEIPLRDECDYDPLFYDCAKLPCADCSWRLCAGGCGQMDQDCACDVEDEYEYACCECREVDCVCDPSAEYPPPVQSL